jgi:hypothetical protein
MFAPPTAIYTHGPGLNKNPLLANELFLSLEIYLIFLELVLGSTLIIYLKLRIFGLSRKFVRMNPFLKF